jgi:nucleotide-binding universal stress UspA family protein
MTMLPLKRILWPTDFSDASYEAVGIVKELASRFWAELWVVYVFKPISSLGVYEPAVLPIRDEELMNSADESLDEVVEQKIGKDFQVHRRVVKGAPAEQIVRVASEEGVDMIVIATHGESGFHHLVFGSVTEKVIKLAPCPVLVIHAHQRRAQA